MNEIWLNKNFADANRANPPSAEGKSRRSLLDTLYQNHRHELCQYLRQKYGNGPPDPEDVVQDTFTKFAELENIRSIQNPRAYLYRMARNILVDKRRRNGTHAKFVTEEIHLADANGSAEIEADRVLIGKEEFQKLEIAIRGLDKRERDFLMLHRLHRLSYTEIGRRAGMSRNGAKEVIRRAFAKCEKAMRRAEVRRVKTDETK